MEFTDKDVIRYINTVQPLFDGVLGDIQKYALEKNIPIVPPEVARLLATLLAIKRPMHVLEIGCAIGFSSGLISRYLAEGGHITTIDRFDVMINQAKENFKRLQIEDKVTLLEGDACKILADLEGEFDVVFLDAAKGQYLNMLPDIMRLLKIGGMLIADDILQSGRIAKDRYDIPRRQRTIQTRMQTFLQIISNTQGLESSILPVGDGVLVVCKTEEFKELSHVE